MKTISAFFTKFEVVITKSKTDCYATNATTAGKSSPLQAIIPSIFSFSFFVW